MLETAIESYLKQETEKAGALCFKFVAPGTRGVPDRIIISKRGVLFVELKRPKGGVFSPHQKRWGRKFKEVNHAIHVVATKKEVDELVKGYLT